jgi:hypothetical protein
MPIPLPDLDDRSYAELTARARALIPALAPEWTNLNPSDPGITLVELLAWLTEMLLYQVNQIPDASTDKFLKLINGSDWPPEPMSLDAAIRQTVLGLREPYRAVTAEDYEWLTLHAWPATEEAERLPGGGKIARVRCVPRRDLSAADPEERRAPAPAHVSLVVLPEPEPLPPGGPGPAGRRRPGAPRRPEAADPVAELHEALWRFFDKRRTLTTHHHIVAPRYVPVRVSANLALRGDAPPQEALGAARDALTVYFDPLTGGGDGEGWPFGRAAYASEVSAVLQGLALLSYVEDVQVSAPDAATRFRADDRGRGQAVLLDADELARLETAELVAYDARGTRYQEP